MIHATGSNRRRWLLSVLLGLSLASAPVSAKDRMPAARQHVKLINNTYVKHVTKLKAVAELNFTFGNDHGPGKALIAGAMDRIARSYGVDGKDAFTVRHITGPGKGAAVGVPEFGVADLAGVEVIVANNISAFGSASLGLDKQTAIRKAIEVDGKGYVALHGSGDNTLSGWDWFTNTLHPVAYKRHGARVAGPVYKHPAEADHVVLENIMMKGILAPRQVPNEVDAAGKELYASLPVRMMKNEWYWFGNDISRDPKFKANVTILLKYDHRPLGEAAFLDEYRRKGGNLYTYLYKVGNGMTTYIPAGHEDDELYDAATGFDGGVGDLDRYLAQTMFFQAGYATTVCDASCDGLPIVDAGNRLTGQRFTPTGVFELDRPAFRPASDGRLEAMLVDVAGRIVARRTAAGRNGFGFDDAGLKPGVYFMTVKSGSSAPMTKRYVIAPDATR